VHRIDRLGAGAPVDPRAATSFNENILSSCSAYGLAIQALGGAKITSSLLPQRIRREKMWQEKTKWFAAAAAVFVAAPLVAYGSIYWGSYSMDQSAQVRTQNVQKLKEFKGYSDEWGSAVEDAGSGDRTRTQNYNSLQLGRETQPALIADIVSCLPQVPADLKAALASGDKSKLPPRNTRSIINIERISMEYEKDMTQSLAMDDSAIKAHEVQSIAPKVDANGGVSKANANRRAAAPVNVAAIPMVMPVAPKPGAAAAAPADTGGPLRGFVIEVICTTPRSDGGSFVLNNFVNKLANLKRSDPGSVSYAVKVVKEPFTQQVGTVASNGIVGGARGGGFRPAQGLGANGQPPPGPEQPKFDPNQDPQTKEDMSADTRVTIRMMVVLDPPAPAPTGTAATN